jgi:HAD superfamily hydrolase (TIGR01509 family)
MRKPKAVVFDLGKVLVDFDFSIATRRMLPRCTGTLNGSLEQFAGLPVLARYETGLITSAEFFEEIRALTGYQGAYAEFSLHFADIFSPIEPMIQLHAQLRARRVPTYIFSNTNDLAIEHVRAKFPFFRDFDGYIFSYEHRAMKPDAKLYEVVERMSGCQGAELLYLDDRLENVEAGARRGWQVVHHCSPEQSRERVESLGLLASPGS